MKQSAGILLYRRSGEQLEVFLTHPGGPIYGHKDIWSIPKGEVDEGETLQQAAIREFEEETGATVTLDTAIDLGMSAQSNHKTNYIFAIEQDFDVADFICDSHFTMEWPPKSGNIQSFAENDKAAWFDIPTAAQKLFPPQVIFLERLAAELKVDFALPQAKSAPEQQSLL